MARAERPRKALRPSLEAESKVGWFCGGFLGSKSISAALWFTSRPHSARGWGRDEDPPPPGKKSAQGSLRYENLGALGSQDLEAAKPAPPASAWAPPSNPLPSDKAMELVADLPLSLALP